MTWILILVVKGWFFSYAIGTIPAITKVEYQSKEACENAAKIVKEANDSWFVNSVAVCTPSDVLRPLR